MIRLILSMALLIQAASGQEIYDLLLKNGNVIDAANRRSGRFDIAVIGTKIRRVGRDLPGAHARVVIDASQYYVTPGLIDIHTHFDAQADGLNLQPEHNAFPAGVTTAVDAGSSDWTKFEEFKAKVIDHSKVRLLAFLEMGNDAQTDPEAVARMARKYSQVIAGIKTFGGVEQAIKVAELSNTIVMVEPSPQSGQQDADSLLKHMRPGDIYTHMYGRIGPQLESMLQARKRGLLFDVGHGSGGFWFRIAAPAINRGLLPDTISTDIDKNGDHDVEAYKSWNDAGAGDRARHDRPGACHSPFGFGLAERRRRCGHRGAGAAKGQLRLSRFRARQADRRSEAALRPDRSQWFCGVGQRRALRSRLDQGGAIHQFQVAASGEWRHEISRQLVASSGPFGSTTATRNSGAMPGSRKPGSFR
jgi:hypothetical protein